MDFENFNELPKEELEAQTQTQTQTEVEQKIETNYELPKLEDLLKSETEVSTIVEPTIEGLKQVDEGSKTVEKTFVRKADEKKAFVKRRVKTITGVYASVFALLLGFVFVNTATILKLNKTTQTNTQQIQSGTTYMQGQQDAMEQATKNKLEVSLNTPRDYGDDETELTFFDRLTILFRSLFS